MSTKKRALRTNSTDHQMTINAQNRIFRTRATRPSCNLRSPLSLCRPVQPGSQRHIRRSFDSLSLLCCAAHLHLRTIAIAMSFPSMQPSAMPDFLLPSLDATLRRSAHCAIDSKGIYSTFVGVPSAGPQSSPAVTHSTAPTFSGSPACPQSRSFQNSNHVPDPANVRHQ